jgi:protoporphyrinogen oxidase
MINLKKRLLNLSPQNNESELVIKMKDENMVDRYASYLNRAMFITNDEFIKKKY